MDRTRCFRCGGVITQPLLGPQTSAIFLALCERCPVAPSFCADGHHDFRPYGGANALEAWVCAMCGYRLASTAIECPH